MESEIEAAIPQAVEGELESEAPETGSAVSGEPVAENGAAARGEPAEPPSGEGEDPAGCGLEPTEDGSETAGDSSQEAIERLCPADELSDEELGRMLAALLFASPEPLSLGRLASLTGEAPAARLRELLAGLEESIARAGLPLRLAELAGGYQLLTTEDQAETIGQLSRVRKAERLSPAALETLSVVAYRQPVSKAEVEAIRGVQAGPLLRALVDRGLIRVTGRAPVPGNPLQYGTTRQFLEQFGLAHLKDLPRDGELAQG
ncbi:MAG TPA: SMC-Scp complex subunit ScpB [Planctomycetota bacterium]|jgi:segregation and condensation protein B|nr:SMC-Scp complex subunit ScpB [Planctomycetota bacterium]